MSDPRPPSTTARVLGYAGGAFLGLVLLVAVWAKIFDPAAFAETIRSEGLDFAIPAFVMAVIALALEAGLGTALVLGLRRRWVLWPTAALVAFFLFLTGRTYWRALQGILPEDTGCGCFGNLVQRTPAEAFWQDLLLMVPALLLAFVGRSVIGGRPWLRTAVVVLVTVATIVFAALAPGLPLDDWATRLKADADPAAFCAGEGDERVCFDTVVPEAFDGDHVVVITGLDEEAFVEAIPQLNEHVWSAAEPTLWVVSAASEEELFQFRFSQGPAFEVREAPAPMLRALYRTLPRSFRMRDGRVAETWAGLPPLDALAADAAGAGSR